MVHILLDSSPDVQKMAYSMLQVAAQKRTEHLVIEAGVDTSAEANFELPEEVIAIIQNSLNIEEDTPVSNFSSTQLVFMFNLMCRTCSVSYSVGWLSLIFSRTR